MKNDKHRQMWLDDSEGMLSVALTTQQINFLTLLKDGPKTVKQMKEVLTVSTQSIHMVLTRLKKMGYIDRIEAPSKHRSGLPRVNYYYSLREFIK